MTCRRRSWTNLRFPIFPCASRLLHQSTMTIAALELHPAARSQDGVAQMGRMIECNSSRIARAHGSELRMLLVEAGYVGREPRMAALDRQLGMARRTIRIA